MSPNVKRVGGPDVRISKEPPAARGAIYKRIDIELESAYQKHGSLPWGRHEFYAILLEEVDELWQAIKADLAQAEVYKELVQVAAMCVRYYETGDRYRV